MLLKVCQNPCMESPPHPHFFPWSIWYPSNWLMSCGYWNGYALRNVFCTLTQSTRVWVTHSYPSSLKCSDEMSHTGNIFHLAPLKLTIKQGVRLSCCWVWGAGELAHSRTPAWAEAPWKCIGSVPSTFLSLGSLEIHPMFLQWGSFPEKKNDHVLLYLESISRSNNSQSQILWHSEDTHSSSVLGSASGSSIPHHNHHPI